MKALVEIIVGLLFLVLGIFLLTYNAWFQAFVQLLQGGIIIVLLLLGIGILLLGLSDLKG